MLEIFWWSLKLELDVWMMLKGLFHGRSVSLDCIKKATFLFFSSMRRPPIPCAVYNCTRRITGPGSSIGRVFASGMGGRGFKPRPGHTKVFKNGTGCSSLGTHPYGIELGLVDPVSGECDGVLYHVMYLGHATAVRQHYKSERWAPCGNQTPSWYDWKVVKATLNPNKQQQKELTLEFCLAL